MKIGLTLQEAWFINGRFGAPFQKMTLKHYQQIEGSFENMFRKQVVKKVRDIVFCENDSIFIFIHC